MFQLDKIEFGRQEIVLKQIHTWNSLASINQRLRDLGADILFQEQYNDISQLCNRSQYILNFKKLKDEFNQDMLEWHPNPILQDGDFLEWWVNEVSLSNGERLPQSVKDRNGHLANRAAVFLCHVHY